MYMQKIYFNNNLTFIFSLVGDIVSFIDSVLLL